MNAEQLFQKLVTLDENPDIEAKTATECGNPIFESICAFANTNGGHILCGVRKRSDRLYGEYEVVGVEDTDKLQCDISTGCQSQFSRSFAPITRTEILEGKRVVVVQVDELPPFPVPVYFSNKGFPNGVFLRRGSRNYRCSDNDIPELIRHRQTNSFDIEPVEQSNADNFDRMAISEYRQRQKERDPTSDEHDEGEKDFLEGRCCITEREAKPIPTTAGLLLFGTRQSIKRFFPNARIEYFRIPGVAHVSDPGQDPSHDQRIIVDPMVRAIDRAVTHILDDLPQRSTYIEGELAPKELPVIRQRIAREIVVNAMVHRDYMETAPTIITRYANRVVVQNPGSSLLPIERMGQTRSRCRNEKLAASLREIRYAETRGSGVGVLRKRMDDLGFAPPLFDDDPIGKFFTAYLITTPVHHPPYLLLFEALQPLHLEKVEQTALFVACELQHLTPSIYQSLEFCDPDTAAAGLRKLESFGLLRARGSGNNRRYQPTNELMDPAAFRWNSSGLVGNSSGLRANSSVLTTDSSGLRAVPQQMNLEELPDDLDALVRSVGRKASKKRVRHAILALCEWQTLSGQQIALYLGRNQMGLRNAHLSPLAYFSFLRFDKENKNNPGLRYELTDKGREALTSSEKFKDFLADMPPTDPPLNPGLGP